MSCWWHYRGVWNWWINYHLLMLPRYLLCVYGLCMCACTHLYVCVCVGACGCSMSVCMHMHVFAYPCVCICMYLHMHVCVFVYMCLCICIRDVPILGLATILAADMLRYCSDVTLHTHACIFYCTRVCLDLHTWRAREHTLRELLAWRSLGM